jgi:hypothetical protein
VAGENDPVKRKRPPKKALPKDPPLNLSGVKSEDAVRILLNTPHLPKAKK